MYMKETIEKMIHLARLSLPAGELDRFAKKAGHILEYVEKLKSIDTQSVEPTSHALEVVNAFRDDAAKKFPAPEKILDIAPGRFENLFEVPKVIE